MQEMSDNIEAPKIKMKKPPDKNKPYYKVIKTSLKSIVKHDFVVAHLNNTAIMANKIVIHTLQLMKLYLNHLVDNGENIPTINKQFITSLMKIVCVAPTQGKKPSESTKGIKDKLKIFYDEHYRDLQGEVLHYRHMNTILDYLAISILTMYENNIKQHYVEYVERFVNVIWNKKETLKQYKEQYSNKEECKKETAAFCRQLRAIKNDLLNIGKSKISLQIYHDWIDTEVKKITPNRTYKKDSLYYDLQCTPQDYLPNMFYMMKAVESKGETINNVCPLRSDVIPKYFRLDTTSLVHILFTKQQGNKGYYLEKGNLIKFKDRLWKFFFRTEKKFFHLNDDDDYDYKFNYMIETDGVGCSILLIRKDLEGKKNLGTNKISINTEQYIDELSKEQYDSLKDKKVVAIDPNQSDLIHCINYEGNMFRYTQDMKRKETKAKKYRNILQENKASTFVEGKSIVEWETELSHYNKKTLDFNKFKDYIKQKNIMNIALAAFYQTYIYRKLKLSSYINRNKSEHDMLKRFEKLYGNPNETIIGYGDFEQYKHRKYKEPIKGKGFRTLFRKAGYQVYLVDEFRTSCRCSGCHGECSTFLEIENPRPWRKDVIKRHGLVKCKTCHGLWNRDTNACRNIFSIVKCHITETPRPSYLQRARGSINDVL